MSYQYLGEQFDIHTGGIDHIPIHHENEIAQSKGFCGKIPANFWMHVDFLTIDGGKMSKSLNNLYTLQDLADRGYEPLVYRMFNFASNYRNKINFTWDTMDSSKVALSRLREGYLKHKNGTEMVESKVLQDFENRFLEAINDDLNMPVAMSVVWEVVKYPKKSKQLRDLLLKFDQVLGFDLAHYEPEEKELPQEILELVKQRDEARQSKNWAESDRLRDVLMEKGYTVKDTKEGTVVEKGKV